MTGRYVRRRRSAAKSRAPRCRAAGARERPGVGPPVADRSSGRLGSTRLERRARRAERYSRSFERLVRVPYATACVVPQPLLKHGNTRDESSSAARGPFDRTATGFTLSLRGTNERTSERTTVRARARRSRRRTIFFYFKYALRYIRTQHCHGSVSRDRMAHMWRAHSVGRAILRRS